MATRTFTDFDAAFISNPITGDIAVKTDARAISFAIKNLILTLNGERPFNSSIGTPVKKLLFELHGDQLNIMLKKMIADVIQNYEPRAALINTSINDSPDNNAIYITIIYKIINTEQPISVNVVLERTR
jgi:phage baseplate assembly protein W